jgi:hypothetical protein
MFSKQIIEVTFFLFKKDDGLLAYWLTISFSTSELELTTSNAKYID